MKLSKKEIKDAILSNNTARVAEMLEGFGFAKDGTLPIFTSVGKDLMSTILGFASAMSYHDDLDGGLAEELIERTAMTVDIFSFTRLVIAAAEIDANNYDVIPEEVRTALLKNDYTDKIAYVIEKMNDEAFAAMLSFMTGEIKNANVKFSLPIMRHIHAEETIPEDLMLAYMGLCPRETIDEHFGGLHDALGALGGLTLLDVLIGRMHDDGDGDSKDDAKE